jgi:hypothetical protein
MATDSISLTDLARPSDPLPLSAGSERSIGSLPGDCLVCRRVETFARLRMVNGLCLRSTGLSTPEASNGFYDFVGRVGGCLNR